MNIDVQRQRYCAVGYLPQTPHTSSSLLRCIINAVGHLVEERRRDTRTENYSLQPVHRIYDVNVPRKPEQPGCAILELSCIPNLPMIAHRFVRVLMGPERQEIEESACGGPREDSTRVRLPVIWMDIAYLYVSKETKIARISNRKKDLRVALYPWRMLFQASESTYSPWRRCAVIRLLGSACTICESRTVNRIDPRSNPRIDIPR